MLTVSVIIPCFNNQKSIARSIRSAMDQTYPINEIIVIDDASEDGSADIVRDLIAKGECSNLFLIENTVNLGSSCSRNIGWDAAKSSYVAFLDADDKWAPEKIYSQSQFFAQNSRFLVCGHLFGDLYSTFDEVAEGFNVISYGNLLFKNYFSTPTIMLRADIKYRFPENIRMAEDYSLWLDLAYNLGEIPKLNQRLAKCDKNFYGDGGLSGNMISMESAELSVLYDQYKYGRINLIFFTALAIFSLAKFSIRIIKILLR